jgi:hypothetical protein
MDLRTVSQILTLCLFGALGLRLAGRFKRPVRLRTYVLLAVAAVVGSFVGIQARIVSVFGVQLLLNWAIASCCLGMLVGLLARRRAVA